VEEGKGQGGLATSHQYGNALLGVCYQEEKASPLLFSLHFIPLFTTITAMSLFILRLFKSITTTHAQRILTVIFEVHLG